ncbi:hypothetical protein KKE92_04760 [Candidatus Micrarchaeota archaeon]|nr:hypothetical protein [Candidatus Micrarchaeota archaeon]
MTKQKKNDAQGKGNARVYLSVRERWKAWTPLVEKSPSQDTKVDELLQRMRVDYDAHSAYEDIVSMGEAAVPRLIELLTTGSFETPDEAGVVLGGIGKVAVPKLIEALDTDNPKAREDLIDTLAYITSDFTADDWKETCKDLDANLVLRAANAVSEAGHREFASRIKSGIE